MWVDTLHDFEKMLKLNNDKLGLSKLKLIVVKKDNDYYLRIILPLPHTVVTLAELEFTTTVDASALVKMLREYVQSTKLVEHIIPLLHNVIKTVEQRQGKA